MDNNNWRLAQDWAELAIDTGDWRTQLQNENRQMMVNKITDTLKRHLPFSGQEGQVELKRNAIRFEERMFTAATSHSDYLRKISLKMLTIESKRQNPMANSLPSNPTYSSKELEAEMRKLKEQLPNAASGVPEGVEEVNLLKAEVLQLKEKLLVAFRMSAKAMEKSEELEARMGKITRERDEALAKVVALEADAVRKRQRFEREMAENRETFSAEMDDALIAFTKDSASGQP